MNNDTVELPLERIWNAPYSSYKDTDASGSVAAVPYDVTAEDETMMTSNKGNTK
jgi:hypothetical protein